MRPPITLDDWNVKYFISQASNKENMRNDSVRLSLSGEKVEWNSKARSRRSDKQSWNTSKATNQNSTRSFVHSFVQWWWWGAKLRSCPLFVYRRCFSFYWFIDGAYKERRRRRRQAEYSVSSHPSHVSFHVPKRTLLKENVRIMNESVLKPVSRRYSCCEGGVRQFRHGPTTVRFGFALLNVAHWPLKMRIEDQQQWKVCKQFDPTLNDLSLSLWLRLGEGN